MYLNFEEAIGACFPDVTLYFELKNTFEDNLFDMILKNTIIFHTARFMLCARSLRDMETPLKNGIWIEQWEMFN